MQTTNNHYSYVQQEPVASMSPPASSVGIVGWMRANLFSSIGNTVLTLIALYFIYSIVSTLIDFLFINAVWSGIDRNACLAKEKGEHIGACWPYIKAYFPQFIYGRYPFEERYRIDLAFIIFAIGLILLMIPTVPFKRLNTFFMILLFPLLSYILLVGGLGLPHVETSKWGGLLVTLVVAITGIAVSLPLGIILALGRRSNMPLVRIVCILFIEFWRGVPLITVLFMSSVVLPLFLPEGMTFDKLLRALIGVALFSSAYMAEVVRGGLQAVPQGQYEGAKALGLKYWPMMGLIILPQALKLVIPGIVNTFISLFKDTTLVSIIGLFDLLGMLQSSFTDPKWATPVTSHTGYLFVAAVFWAFCFSMSRYSVYMEKRLQVDHKN